MTANNEKRPDGLGALAESPDEIQGCTSSLPEFNADDIWDVGDDQWSRRDHFLNLSSPYDIWPSTTSVESLARALVGIEDCRNRARRQVPKKPRIHSAAFRSEYSKAVEVVTVWNDLADVVRGEIARRERRP